MSPEPTPHPGTPPGPASAGRGHGRQRRLSGVSLAAQGEALLWLTGGALAVALAMIGGLLALIAFEGAMTFWPVPVVELHTLAGARIAGEVTREESYTPRREEIAELPTRERGGAEARLASAGGVDIRRLVRSGNFDLTGSHYTWVSGFQILRESRPEWVLVLERQTWGRFYGTPVAYLQDGAPAARGPADTWRLFNERHGEVLRRQAERRYLESDAVGDINARLEAQRLALRRVELREGTASPHWARAKEAFEREQAALDSRFAEVRSRIEGLNRENGRHQLLLATADGKEKTIPLADIVRAYAPNRLGFAGRLGVYLSRWHEYLTSEPREANSEGGVLPAIFGTVAMTLIMSLLAVPGGVLAALYLREYARPGLAVSGIRIAINNLAGVPSIVFGVFGLGFFAYIAGGSIDALFYSEKLPNPTFGTGGLLWASLTLALLTLPVVIVATEEALAAVPGSMREGSYACGASKWQTIRRIVLPRAMPGIMTGMILAMARGAGEVAPLMLVGAVKLAPELPVDGHAPFVHLSRSFMHLGFHIYDLGFQSQNSEAAKPMVFTTALLLVAVVAALNVLAIWLRARLRRRFVTSHF